MAERSTKLSKVKSFMLNVFGVSDNLSENSNTKYSSKDWVPVKNWIPIKDIRDGIVILRNGKHLKLIEVTPINFKLKTLREKKMILLNYKAFLKACNFDMQIVMQSSKANIDPHIEMMNKYREAETNENVKKMNTGYTNLVIDMASKKKSISRRFFIVIAYNPPPGISMRNVKFEDILQDLSEKQDKVRDHLKKCGNKIITRRSTEEDKELARIYYTFLNPYLSNNQKLNPDPMSYTGPVALCDSEEYANAKQTQSSVSLGEALDNGRTTIIDVISPGMINPRNPDYIQIDDAYIAHLIVVNYSINMPADWLDELLSINENINVSFHYEKLRREKIIQDIGNTIGITAVTLRHTSEAQADVDILEQTYGDAKYIRKEMSIAQDDLYYFYTYISIYASDLQELQYTLSRVESVINSFYMQSRRANFRQEQAFKTVMPLFMNEFDEIKRAARRNVLTKGLSSTYAFRSAEICDNDGIFVGKNEHNQSLVLVDFFNTEKYKNANVNILGTSGAGKTFLLNLIAGRIRAQGKRVMIIAPLKGHEFKRQCKAYGGEYFKLSPDSDDCINILDIRKSTAEDIFEDEEDVFSKKGKRESSLLLAKIQKLHIFFSLLLPDMTIDEWQELDDALIKVYTDKGITFDNVSLYSDEIGNTLQLDRKFKVMPLPGDLYDIFVSNKKTSRLAALTKRFTNGSLQKFNNHTNVDLDNKYIVADISQMPNELLPFAMFTVIDQFWDSIKEDPSVEKVFILDELWKLLAADGSEQAAEFVFELFKIIRGYGGAAIAATQNVKDFFALKDGKYGNGIINNSKIKFVLQLEKNDIKALKEVLDLSEEEEAKISSFSRGQALFYAGDSHIAIEIIASDVEEELITTDRKRLSEIKEKRKSRKVHSVAEDLEMVLEDEEENILN